MESSSNQPLLKEKLGFFGVLKEAIKIPFKNPNFIIFTCLTSLPMFCSLFMYEHMFLQTLIEAAKVLQLQEDADPTCKFCNGWQPLMAVELLLSKVSHNVVLLILLHIGILHLCDLFNMVATVNSASALYAGDTNLTLQEMFSKHLLDSRLKGPFITSIYVLLLTSLLSIGLFSLIVYIYIISFYPLFMMLFLAMFVALSRQYLEWSAIWDMGTLISVLEEKEGDVALVISKSLSRGNRGVGILLMIGYLLWRLSLTLVRLFIAWNGGGVKILISILNSSLICLVNVLKWVSFVVYYIDCKKRRSGKEVSVEGDKDILNVCF